MIEGRIEQIEVSRRHRGFGLVRHRRAVPDTKPGENQSDARGRRTGVIGEQTRPAGSAAGAQIGEVLECPHRAIRYERVRIVKNRVRRGQIRKGVGRGGPHPLTKISEMQLPPDRSCGLGAVGQRLEQLGVGNEVTEFVGVIEREPERLESLVERMELNLGSAAETPKKIEHRDGVRGRAEPDIPNDKSVASRTCPFEKMLLAKMQFARFAERTEHGMKRLPGAAGTQSASAGPDGDDLKTGLPGFLETPGFAQFTRRHSRRARSPPIRPGQTE